MSDAEALFEQFATKQQVAELFGVTPRTIERWVRLRTIPQPRRVGRQRLFYLPEMRKALAKEAA